MLIEVLDLIGPYAIATASGEKLQTVIRDGLQEKGPIILDFTGGKVVTAAFFNSAIAEQIYIREWANFVQCRYPSFSNEKNMPRPPVLVSDKAEFNRQLPTWGHGFHRFVPKLPVAISVVILKNLDYGVWDFILVDRYSYPLIFLHFTFLHFTFLHS